MIDPIVVSYSELDTFRQCPLKHYFAYVQRYTKTMLPGSPALSRGSLWHLAMETHYNTIKDNRNLASLRLARSKVDTLLQDPKTGQRDEQQALIWWMYEGHVERYNYDREWTIEGVEVSFEVELVPATPGNPPIHLKGKIDLLVRDKDGRLWVVDHKSGAELPSTKVLDIDDQFGLYLVAAEMFLGEKPYGAIHSAARTRRLKGDEDGSNPTPLVKRFSRTTMSRTPIELVNLWEDARRAAVAAYRDRSGPPYSSPNPDQCRWKCDFLDAHMLMRKGVRPETAMHSFGFEQRFERH